MIGLARRNDGWVVGFLRRDLVEPLVATLFVSSWSDAKEPLRLMEQSLAKDAPEPKAISCYGLFLPELEKMWLRFSWMDAR